MRSFILEYLNILCGISIEILSIYLTPCLTISDTSSWQGKAVAKIFKPSRWEERDRQIITLYYSAD